MMIKTAIKNAPFICIKITALVFSAVERAVFVNETDGKTEPPVSFLTCVWSEALPGCNSE